MGSDVQLLIALHKKSLISNFTLNVAVAVLLELAVSAAYFTHISHQLGRHETVTAELPDGIKLAHDSLVIFSN